MIADGLSAPGRGRKGFPDRFPVAATNMAARAQIEVDNQAQEHTPRD